MNDLLEIFRAMLPVRKEALWGMFTGAFGVAAEYLFGAWNDALEALVFCMCADYISGLLAAYLNPGMKLDSRVGFKGICKKLMIVLLVAVAHFLDRATGQAVIESAAIFFFIGNEGLSILENAGKAGLPIPKKLRQTLAQLTEEKEERGAAK